MKKFFTLIVFGLIMLAAQKSFAAQIYFDYQAHVQNIGWMHEVQNGETAGTVGQGLRMEALVINLTDDSNNSIVEYCAHVQDVGWQGWVYSGEVAGTVGQNLRMEAVRIRLTRRYADEYDIYYRAHVQDGGWLGWARNGEPAGTQGAGLRMEAVQICIVPKGHHFNRGGRAFYQKNNGNERFI